MDADSHGESRASWWKRHAWTIILVTFFVLLSGAFRVAFNYDAANNEGEYRYAGNDDYYHLWIVESVQTTGNHVVRDPMLNYPVPANNPRPPLYDWHVAIGGQILGFFSGEGGPGRPALTAGKYALEWGSALWGALTVIPIWLIGRATFSNKVGLWAAFLIAASPAHIQRSGYGLGDHDAFIVFFLCLGAYFLVRALQLTRDDVRVERWARLDGIGRGFGDYFFAHTEGLAYAFLTAVCWAAIGLAWEGYTYVLAIYAVYYTLQLISNQIRRRDSTGDFLVFVIISGVSLLLTLPYYWITGNIGSTLNSAIYLFIIMGVLSLALIPTRDLPAILVIPSLVGIGVVGLLVLLFVFPDIGNQLFSANGYFNRSKLYSTIAEAQRTELGVFVFSVGFMTFFFALVGFVMGIVRYLRGTDRALLFLVGWGLLSIYMGFAATRFIFNAAPIFAVFAGWVTAQIVAWMKFRERFRSFASLRQDSLLKATRSVLGARQVAGSLFLILFLIVPNTWFSVDAGISSEFRANYRQNHPGASEFITNQTGAFGQAFLDPNWLVVYGWLDEQDTHLPPAQRPAHIAWWDYGFWEIPLAHHPTVADNFQNGFQLAGRFLAAQSEKEAIDWLSIRVIEGDWGRNARQITPPVSAHLASVNASWPEALNRLANRDHYDEAYRFLQSDLVTLQDSVDFYEGLLEATKSSQYPEGTRIEYFLVDNRMLPFDDPSTGFIESGSILYAPIFLANKNPDDFVQTVYVDQRNNEYAVKAYRTDENGNSVQESPAQIVDETGRCYFVSGGLLFRGTQDCKRIDYSFNAGQGLPLTGTRLKFQDAYYQTMFYRGFVGGERPPFGDYPPEAFQGNGTAGQGLRHFRVVNMTPSIKLLQYYPGAVVTGKVQTSAGSPLAGYTIVAQDPFGIDHDQATIGADGTYRLLAPFSLSDETGVRLVVRQGASDIMTQTIQVSRDQAQRRVEFNLTLDFDVEPGTLNGFVFFDRDRSGSYNESIDRPLSDASVRVDQRNITTGPDGRFAATDVLPGAKTVTADRAGYSPSSASATIPPGGTANVTIAISAAPVPVNGTLRGADGVGLPSFVVEFRAENPTIDYTANTSAFTDGAGVFQTSVTPGGRYTVLVNGTTTEDNRTVRYRGQTTIDVPIGSPPIAVGEDQLVLTRTEEP